MERIVLKLGGSHLDRADWAQRFIALIDRLGQHEYFLIVGGGEAIDAMRKLDRIHQLNEVDMHWRCVELLQATTDIAIELLHHQNSGITIKRCTCPDEFGQLIRHREPRTSLHVVDSIAFYNRENQPAESLASIIPCPQAGWRTTTDAIAIYGATLLQADRCVLLKSCEIDPCMYIMQAALLGIVDQESPRMAAHFANVELLKL